MDATSPQRRFHLALAVDDLEATIADYTVRLGEGPAVVVPGRYAVWRTPEVNLSVSVVTTAVGVVHRLRHVGFCDPDAVPGPRTVDVNGIQWEAFTTAHQDTEITRTYGPPA